MYTYAVSPADDPADFQTFSSASDAEYAANAFELHGDEVVRWRAVEDYESTAGRVERPGWRSVDYFA